MFVYRGYVLNIILRQPYTQEFSLILFNRLLVVSLLGLTWWWNYVKAPNAMASTVRVTTEESSSEGATSEEVTFQKGGIRRVQYLLIDKFGIIVNA